MLNDTELQPTMPSEDATLTAEVALTAFRQMDRSVLRPAVLKALALHTLPEETARVIGDPTHLASFLHISPNEAKARRGEMGRKVWRRLADVLDGRMAEGSIADGFSEAEISSLHSLISSAESGQAFRMLYFPLKPGEATWLHLLAGILMPEKKAKPTAPLTIVPVESSYSPAEEVRIPKHYSGGAMVTWICQQAKIHLSKGQAAEIAGAMRGGWRPQTVGDALGWINGYVARDKVRKDSQSAMYSYLEASHGLPKAACESVVCSLTHSTHAPPPTEPREVAELLAEHVPGMVARHSLESGLQLFHQNVAKTKFFYFEKDLSNPKVMERLQASDINGAKGLLTGLRDGRARDLLSTAMGSNDLAVITRLAKSGDGRPAAIVKALIHELGSTFLVVAKRVAATFGADKQQAAEFASACRVGAVASEERMNAARQKTTAWQASLINAPEARILLGATPTEFRRWLDDKLIPIARVVEFQRWGTELKATRHDPAEIERIRPLVPMWRLEHASEVTDRRRKSAKEAAAARKLADRPAPTPPSPFEIRKRRLSSLLKSAGLNAKPAPSTTIDVSVSSEILSDLEWTVTLRVPSPGDVEASIHCDAPAAVGKLRALSVEKLRDAIGGLRDEVVHSIAGVIAAWRERVDSVSDGFPNDGAAAFDAAIRREVSVVAGDGPGRALSASEIPGHLSTLLERSLASAVNSHAREWGVDDLRVRSGLADYAAMFPEARAKKRHFILNFGPTNSGKTHAAMDRLAAASSGAYLAPLRLMALEGAERLNGERGVPTDMVTGEEMTRVEGSRHVSATIEMADLLTPIEVAIVDEVQMIADRDRGWAWTQALVGIPADIIVMTGSVDALPYVTRIARMTGDTLEVIQFERMTPLEPMDKPVSLSAVRDGDAVIAFSRAEVLRLRDELTSRGVEVATIYGALGPEVRRTQAARFRSGEAKVLVATDAIAMGLNLPIKRVILSALEKFDGQSVRLLTASEIRQVGGRAGRYGITEHGEVGVTQGLKMEAVRAALISVPRAPRDDRVPVMPPWAAVEAVSRALSTEDLGAILQHVTQTLLKGALDLRAPSLEDVLSVAAAISKSGLSLRNRFRYLGCPIESRDPKALPMVARWANAHGAGSTVQPPRCHVTGVPETSGGLSECEQAVKHVSAYLWLALRYPGVYDQHDEATRERDRLNLLIDAALRRRSIGRSCKKCGDRLPRNHRFSVCDDCFKGNHYRN